MSSTPNLIINMCRLTGQRTLPCRSPVHVAQEKEDTCSYDSDKDQGARGSSHYHPVKAGLWENWRAKWRAHYVSSCLCIDLNTLAGNSAGVNPLSTDGHYSGHLTKSTFLKNWQIQLFYIHYRNFKEFTTLVCVYFLFLNLLGVFGTLYKSMYSL